MVSCEMSKKMILLPVHSGLPLAVFLEAGIPLWGVFDEVEPGLVFGAQLTNVRSMPGGPDMFLDIARIGEPFGREFAFGERTLRGPGHMVLISPDCGRKLGQRLGSRVAARYMKFTFDAGGTRVWSSHFVMRPALVRLW